MCVHVEYENVQNRGLGNHTETSTRSRQPSHDMAFGIRMDWYTSSWREPRYGQQCGMCIQSCYIFLVIAWDSKHYTYRYSPSTSDFCYRCAYFVLGSDGEVGDALRCLVNAGLDKLRDL